MNQHKASNVTSVHLDSNGRMTFRRDSPLCVNTLEAFWVQAAREYFQAERDEALGRWRDPENPNVVVYPVPDQDDGYGRVVWVLDEAEMVSMTVLDDRHSHSSASRYFDAHPLPEPEPKPWENAKEGDYWVLTIGGEPSLWHRGVRRLFWTDGERLSGTALKDATAGRRIWPEGEASE